jgi:hypothetical protein
MAQKATYCFQLSIKQRKTNMPPAPIIPNINELTQTKLLPNVKKKWRTQLSFGLKAFALRPFQSTSSNARQIVPNTNTAYRKAERLLANIHLTSKFGNLFDALCSVKPSHFINCDHSDFAGLTAFVCAVQTKRGRAVPCLIETTYSDCLPSMPTAPKRRQKLRRARAKEREIVGFTEHYIDALQGLAERLGFWPKLVFDRGFSNESLIVFLESSDATFYVRLKAGRIIELDGHRTTVEQIAENDTTVELFGLTLRVVRSDKARRTQEPWYILTNDHASSRAKIIQIYYHRFEIEETFKDIKHLWELKRARFNKPTSLKAILWLVSIGIALLYLSAKTVLGILTENVKVHPKKKLSWIRQAYEQLQRDCTKRNLSLWEWQ